MTPIKKSAKSLSLTSSIIALSISCQYVQAAWDGNGFIAEKIKQRIEQRITMQHVQQSTRRIDFDGMQRTYQIYEPASSSTIHNLPVVIALHGGGGNASQMMKRWQTMAEQQDFILIAPQGIGANARMGTWNAQGCCGEAMKKKVNDLEFVQQILKDVSRNTPIDHNKIYMVGFSNGGMLAHQLAISMGSQLAAVAVVSGALFGNETAAKSPVPILMIHGEQDSVVPFHGGMSPTHFVARAQKQSFQSVTYAMNYWKTNNQCQGNMLVQKTAMLRIEKGLNCKADVVLYDVTQGQHVWPTVDHHDEGFDATQVIWSFFRQYAR
ncbi:alpha/beta hydrolase family esterase [Acinetobacter ihumii]|uniref:alpha/beta hydrolase family esterase n=1 Tax=Acinetobacter ihumii TaxID=2483802 RepID=UPI001030D544|nr:PHB depolymerase family esterase [Acinetobacter ihumii]